MRKNRSGETERGERERGWRENGGGDELETDRETETERYENELCSIQAALAGLMAV